MSTSYTAIGSDGTIYAESDSGKIYAISNLDENILSSALAVVNGTNSCYNSSLTGIPSGYFNSSLTGTPSGYLIQNGTYSGWCVDKSTVMIRGVTHNITLYSRLNSTLPPSIASFNWNAINYILNHKQGTMQQIQDAIWYFAPDQQLPPTNEADAYAMINAALANPQYMPIHGNILAVIAYSGSQAGVQNTILEYPVP